MEDAVQVVQLDILHCAYACRELKFRDREEPMWYAPESQHLVNARGPKRPARDEQLVLEERSNQLAEVVLVPEDDLC